MALRVFRAAGRTGLAGVLVAALALSACGRKGPLEPPPRANAVEESTVIQDGAASESATVEEKPAPKPARSFPLDFLI